MNISNTGYLSYLTQPEGPKFIQDHDDDSLHLLHIFSQHCVTRFQKYGAEFPDTSCVSMKSSHSMFNPPHLSTGGTGFDPR